jgi:hypothetical protein
LDLFCQFFGKKLLFCQDFRVNDLGAMLKGRKVIRHKASTSTVEILNHVANKEKTV